MDAKVAKPKVVPFSLKDAPSLIERVWPAQKISVESQKERKAGSGQTLTALGSYWKGRKPLILVRACVLAALLPATGDDEKDIAIFELLAGMRDDQIVDRFKVALTVDEIEANATAAQRTALLEKDEDGQLRLKKLSKESRNELMSAVIARMPYLNRVDKLLRPEEVSENDLTAKKMAEVNQHLGTSAKTLPELVEQLGIMRFGRRPNVADTFSGGGSIPFEAARLGCDVQASDLNPIGCMLTWGALNIIGGTSAYRSALEKKQIDAADAVQSEIDALGIDKDKHGNVAKAFLYCLETRCPQTGWMVPLAPSWIISQGSNVIAKLVPQHKSKTFAVEIHVGVSQAEMKRAEKGTVQNGKMVYELDNESYSTPIAALRGESKAAAGAKVNNLRQWELEDIKPLESDVFQERLYCVQWISAETKDQARPDVHFRSVDQTDIEREHKAERFVASHIREWRQRGFMSDMRIETGKENEGPIRTNGWTYWHHFFTPRQLLYHALYAKYAHHTPELNLISAKMLDYCNKSSQWRPRGDYPEQLFSGPSLKTMFTWGARAYASLRDTMLTRFGSSEISGSASVYNKSAREISSSIDVFITDPPYADAVRYEEITEFFIAWLRKNPPPPFSDWIWDSRRALTIGGNEGEFRKGMIESYGAMANHMPDNGIQIVMFTHQSASVWADMAQIFWGAGLQVMAAWYIATETTSELKKGGYVQGTVILVLRKRKISESGYKDEIVQEVKAEVAAQIDTMVGLNQTLRGHGRVENLFEDADLQMAGYAAALRVLTRYEKIDGVDMTKELLRQRKTDEKNLVGEVIEFAVQVANEHMVPEHMPPKVWERLSGPERFYLKMMDIETTALRKLDNYQNFAKAFRVGDYGAFMGNVEPNKAHLKSAKQFKKSGFEITEFGPSATRAALYAIFELENEVEGDDVLSHLKDLLPNYHSRRDDLVAIADYIARKRTSVDEAESRAARILYGLIRNERLG